MLKIVKDNLIYEIIFIFFMSIFFILFLNGLLLDYNGDQAEVFFLKTKDYMADFYNNCKYSVDRDPYFNTINGLGEKPYLPISYVLMYYLSNLADYDNPSSFNAGMSTIGLATSSIFMFILSAILFLQIYDMKNGSKVKKFIFTLLMFLSGIFLFSFERGNLIILSVIFTNFYLYNYHSSNKYIKEFAYICLGLAASLKVYPALLGILLIYDKNYKGAIRLIIYGLFFSFLPFTFLDGGLTNITQWFKNVSLNSELYKFRYYPRFGYKFFLINLETNLREMVDNILTIIVYIISLLSLCFNFSQHILWKKMGLLICIIILIPTNSGFYCGLYLFPIIIMFLNEKKHKSYEIIYLICFLALLNPYQIIINNINYTMIAINLSVTILFILLFEESTITFRKLIFYKKQFI